MAPAGPRGLKVVILDFELGENSVGSKWNLLCRVMPVCPDLLEFRFVFPTGYLVRIDGKCVGAPERVSKGFLPF